MQSVSKGMSLPVVLQCLEAGLHPANGKYSVLPLSLHVESAAAPVGHPRFKALLILHSALAHRSLAMATDYLQGDGESEDHSRAY